MPIIYRIISSQDSALRQLGEKWWILSCISEWKMYFWKEEKRTVRKPRTVESWDDFQDFYRLYPHKKGKENARVMWSRLTEKERELAHAWLIRYIAYWKQKAIEKQFLPHPATWLHQKRWEDDLSDNVILSKPIENIQKELDEEKKHREEKERIDRMIYNLRQDPIKWKEVYDKAKSQIPPAQLNFAPNIVESLILTRIKINLNDLWH
mgnify:CR=1 FL=1